MDSTSIYYALNDFMESYGILLNDEQINMFGGNASPNVVEDMLLQLANIPEKCEDPQTSIVDDDHIFFSIKGLSLENEAKLRNLFNDKDIETGSDIFVVTAKHFTDKIIPKLKSMIIKSVNEKTSLLKPYICSGYVFFEMIQSIFSISDWLNQRDPNYLKESPMHKLTKIIKSCQNEDNEMQFDMDCFKRNIVSFNRELKKLEQFVKEKNVDPVDYDIKQTFNRINRYYKLLDLKFDCALTVKPIVNKPVNYAPFRFFKNANNVRSHLIPLIKIQGKKAERQPG